jgi:hypothetical protein
VQRLVKNALTSVGRRCSARTIHRLNAVINYLEVGRWMREHGHADVPRVSSREEVFGAMAREVADEAVLYLEFGVYEGASMRWWSRTLRSPDARLHGFDSFEGLPEPWSVGEGKGHFSTGGRVPELDDPRVEFHKGWFEETLPSFRIEPAERLVANLDADLYSSTAYVLSFLRSSIVPGTYLYFDEFHDRAHELRAFDEFLRESGRSFSAVAATSELTHVAFRCEA